MAKKPETNSRIAENKKAAFNYFFEERHEAGIVLQGWEVKALRSGKAQISEAYVVISTDATRLRKLLMKKDEIRRLIGKVEQKGYTLVPTNLHWKNGLVKCDVALAKGKAEHDKRDVIKDREGKREVERAMKSRNR